MLKGKFHFIFCKMFCKYLNDWSIYSFWIMMVNSIHAKYSSLRNLVKDFQDLAEICLLLLHLEVRVHCFYFLLPVAKQVCDITYLIYGQISRWSNNVEKRCTEFTLIIFLFQSNYAGPIDDLDPDSNVLKLNKDLTSMEEVLQQSLQPKKFK